MLGLQLMMSRSAQSGPAYHVAMKNCAVGTRHSEGLWGGGRGPRRRMTAINIDQWVQAVKRWTGEPLQSKMPTRFVPCGHNIQPPNAVWKTVRPKACARSTRGPRTCWNYGASGVGEPTGASGFSFCLRRTSNAGSICEPHRRIRAQPSAADVAESIRQLQDAGGGEQPIQQGLHLQTQWVAETVCFHTGPSQEQSWSEPWNGRRSGTRRAK